jgi:hypothetical protein
LLRVCAEPAQFCFGFDQVSAITAKAQTGRDRRVRYNPTVIDALADLLVSQEQEAWQQVFR